MIFRGWKTPSTDWRYMDKDTLLGILIGLIFILFIFGISWLATCGIIKLITLCFGWTFKWSIATGIWLIMCLLQSVFKTTVKTK